jgi:hypothetical protein
VQALQREAGIGTEFDGQPVAYLLVAVQCLSRPATAVQGDHELSRQTFVQRVAGRPRQQIGQQRGVQAEAEPDIGEIEPDRVQVLDQGGAHGVQPASGQTGERLPAPQRHRLLEQRGGPAVVLSGTAVPDQPAKPVQIHQLGLDSELVAGRPARDRHTRGRSQRIAQQGHAVLHRGARITGKPAISPDPVHQLIDRHPVIGLDQQHRQHTSQLRVTDRDRPPMDIRLDVTKQTEPHRHLVSSLRPGAHAYRV